MSTKLFAIDNSGSTSNNTNYWKTVNNIVKDYTNSNFVLWNSDTTEICDFKTVAKNITEKYGTAGTSPNVFLKHIKNDMDLVIITDGQIDSSNVAKCHDTLDRMKVKLNDVQVYFIGDEQHMNLSVAAPFTKLGNSCLLKVNDENIIDYDNLDLNLEQYYNNFSKFLEDYDTIYKKVTLLNLGNTNDKIRAEIIKLQNQLMNNIASQVSQSLPISDIIDTIRKNTFESVGEVMSLITKYDFSVNLNFLKEIQSSFGKLLAAFDNKNDFSFNRLRHGKIARASEIDEASITNTKITEDIVSKFECPILLDVDTPVLLIKDGDPILSDPVLIDTAEKIAQCPWTIFFYPELIEKVISRLDHPLGYTSTYQMFQNSTTIQSPLTRSNCSTALIFSQNQTKVKEANNYTLAKLLFGKKLLGGSDVWMAILFLIIKNCRYLSENVEFMETVSNYIIDRSSTCSVPITLTSSFCRPIIQTPLNIAVWYCINSYKLYNCGENNRFFAMYPFLDKMLELCKLFSLPVVFQEEMLVKADITRVLKFLGNKKRESGWNLKLRSLWQNSVTIDDNIFMLDGPNKSVAITDVIPFPTMLTIPQIYSLSKLVTNNTKIGNIILPDSVDKLNATFTVVKNYGYQDSCNTSPIIPINIDTLLPFKRDLETLEEWKVEAKKKFQCPIEKLLSMKFYIREFIIEHRRLPSKVEYLKHMQSRQKFRYGIDTLPEMVSQWADEVIDQYSKFDLKNFLKKYPESTRFIL